MISLSECLYGLEFYYKKINDKTIQLIDLLGANLGNIESEEFEISEYLPMNLVDRLDTYIYDYHIQGIEDTLIHECQYKDDIYPYDEKLIPVTVIEAGPNFVVQLKSDEKDGYKAVTLAYDEKKVCLSDDRFRMDGGMLIYFTEEPCNAFILIVEMPSAISTCVILGEYLKASSLIVTTGTSKPLKFIDEGMLQKELFDLTL